jgi:hypothetical protein
VDEWLPERHLARFIVEVVERLDLSAMSGSYRALTDEASRIMPVACGGFRFKLVSMGCGACASTGLRRFWWGAFLTTVVIG